MLEIFDMMNKSIEFIIILIGFIGLFFSGFFFKK